jgi:hypothetical protein
MVCPLSVLKHPLLSNRRAWGFLKCPPLVKYNIATVLGDPGCFGESYVV